MARLPDPGGDDNSWGAILNDFLGISHNDDGTLVPSALIQAGAVQVAGDIGGSATSPSVTATHLSAALPVDQGGTGSTSQNFVDLTNDQTKVGMLTVPVQDKGGQVFNAKAYGAVGDGATDDTTALQAAIDAAASAGGGVVFVPASSTPYKITAALRMHSGVTLRGAGAAGRTNGSFANPSQEIPTAATIIHQVTANTHGITNTDVVLEHVAIEHIQIVGTGSGTGIGVYFDWEQGNPSSGGRLNYVVCRNLTVYNFGSDGIRLHTPIVSHLQTVIAQNNGGNGIAFYDGGVSCSFASCWALGNAGSGYYLGEVVGGAPTTNGPIACTFTSCASDNNAVGYTINNAQTVTFTGCDAEHNTGTALYINGSNTINVHGFEVVGNNAVGIWVTGPSYHVQLFGCADSTVGGSPTAFIQVDSGSQVTTCGIDYAAGDTPIYASGSYVTQINAGGGNMILPGSLVMPSNAPANSGSAGATGQITWDANYLYVCTAANTWKRVALSTF